MSVLVIGISGKAGHGKDSFARILGSEMFKKGIPTQSVCFADRLKEIAKSIFFLDRKSLWGDYTEKEKPIERLGGITGRFILQKLGTEVARSIYKDVWVLGYDYLIDKTVRDYTNKNWKDLVIVTSDLRFKNEYEYLKNKCPFQSLVVRVVRPGFKSDGDAEHASETDLDSIAEWNYVVEASNMGDLELKVHAIALDIGSRYFNER